MADIVERLRVHAKLGDGWTRPDAAIAAREIEQLRAEIQRLRRSWLSVIQAENNCPTPGGGCFAKRCGCLAEMDMLISECENTNNQGDTND
jgi:hypothetical protein